MASSTYGTYLLIAATYNGETWTTSTNKLTKLVDIKDFPDLGGEPELIDITTLSDKQRRNIFGVEALDSLPFTANYSREDMEKLDSLEHKEWSFVLMFSTGQTPFPESGEINLDGPGIDQYADEGYWGFKGYLSARPLGKGVNEAREIGFTIANTTEVKFNHIFLDGNTQQ